MKYSLLSKYRSELMGVAMLAVMLFHAGDLDLGLRFLNDLRQLGFGGVDIFMLLSGMGLAMSLSRREQEYGAFMGRRLRRILPAYYAVMLPYTLCLFLVGRALLSTFIWNTALLNFWVGPMGGFNWYITGIVTFYILTPQTVRFLREHPRLRVPALLAVTVLSVGLSQILIRDTYWNHVAVIYRAPMYFAGLVIGLWIAEGRKLAAADAAALILLPIPGVVYACLRTRLGDYAQAVYIFLFTTVSASLALAWIMDKLPLKPLWAALRFVGENSLEIYLLNVSFFAERDFLRRFFDPGPGHYIYWAVSFALNILLGWALHVTLRVVTEKLFRGSGERSPAAERVR